MNKHFLWGMLLTFSLSINAQNQAPPSTDIYVYDLKEKKGKITLSKGQNITDRDGYDNQPHFYTPEYLLYTSYRDGQTDIFVHDLYEGKSRNMTKTKESEYSAVMVPGFDSYASVRVEEDGRQRLWLFHMDTKKEPQLVFDDLAPVGYHAWSGTDVATFILGDPVSLVLTNAKERKDRIITKNIGRTLKHIPGTKDFAFERTEESGEQVIYRLNVSSGEFQKIISKPGKAPDWTITMEGTFITSVGTELMAYNPKSDQDWKPLTDLGSQASKGITRMAVSDDNRKIAIVINR